MKVILDTNVFVSGVFFKGPPYQILEAWKEGSIQLVLSVEILEEYRRVGEILAEEYPHIDLEPFLELVIQNSAIYAVPELKEPICVDPADDKFLACAIASGSKVIVSGDKHLLNLCGYQEIEVLKPRQFLERIIKPKYKE